MSNEKRRKRLSDLINLACQLGATSAEAISSTEISVEDNLANLCTTCENYGLSLGCPPNVSGPSGFRKALENFVDALVLKIDVPSEILFSSDRQEIFRLLHEIAAGLEQSAREMGYGKSKAYVGGSCKAIFCREHPKCRVLSGEGECRNPRHARPSMSGFGINVSKLMQAAGWTMERASAEARPGESSMGTVCGLVLIG